MCNLVYKIISNILTNQLKKVLSEVINLNQSAFLEDRLITDNKLIVHEILHSLKNEGSMGSSSLALKLDRAKAYDRVEWAFVEQMVRRLGFDSIFIGWVVESISFITCSVIDNGEARSRIILSQGLCQEDPLSPFLFLLCAEGLSAMIKRHEEQGALHGFRFLSHGVSISHLFCADDAIIFCKVDKQEVRCIKHILVCYEQGSS